MENSVFRFIFILFILSRTNCSNINQQPSNEIDWKQTNQSHNTAHVSHVTKKLTLLNSHHHDHSNDIETYEHKHFHHHSSTNPVNIANTSNVYLTFTQTWKNEECFDHKQNQNCQQISSLVTIHGLWPSFFADTTNIHGEPNYCRQTELQPSDLTSISSQLSKSWPSFVLGNFEFWQHEWEKHGTCWLTKTPIQYFETGLNYYTQYNVTQLLINNNIKPGVYYHFEIIKNIFSNAWGKKGFVQCVEDGSQYIASFKTCFNWKGFLIDCPDVIPNGNNCGSKVILSV